MLANVFIQLNASTTHARKIIKQHLKSFPLQVQLFLQDGVSLHPPLFGENKMRADKVTLRIEREANQSHEYMWFRIKNGF